MNIIEMAIKANLLSGGKEKMSKNLLKVEETIEAQVLEFASLVAAHEREACAKACDGYAAKAEANGYTCKGETFIDGFGDGFGACAAAIRARGEK